MRALHVVPWLTLRAGGTSAVVVGLGNAEKELGIDVSVATTDIARSAQSTSLSGGATLLDFPVGADHLAVSVFAAKRPLRIVYSPTLGRFLCRTIPKMDIVHIHSMFLYPQFIAARVCQQFHIPYIVSPHGAFDPFLRERGKVRKTITELAWQRSMMNHAAAIHLTSQEELQQTQEMGYSAPHVVLPIGIDGGFFDIDKEQGVPKDSWIIAHHGRITAKKGLDTLVEALPIIQRACPAARLVLAGPDDEGLGKLLLKRGEELGIAGSIELPGQLSGEPLHDLLMNTAVWALPSRGENFGLAMVEALAAGRAVVTTPEVNIAKDAAAAGALVIAQRDPGSFAQAIVALLESREQRVLLRMAARAYAQHYSWNNTGRGFLDLYRSVLK